MQNSRNVRAIVYIGLGLMLLFAVYLSGIFSGKPRDGVLPPVNMDDTTAEHLQARQWDSAMDGLIPLFEHTNDPNLKPYIAWCYKELGIEAFLDKRYQDAALFSESGLMYAAQDPDLNLILGGARLAQSDYDGAEAAFMNVLMVDPVSAAAYKQLGDIHYLRNELVKAEAAWSKAHAQDPEDTALEKRLSTLRKQLHLNETLENDDSLHFSVIYDGEMMPQLENTVLDMLENVYYDIGGKLGIYPKRQISITLLTHQAFFDVTGSPGWTAGLYEGQIKIPVAGVDPDKLKKTLQHEYTHAVLFDQLGNRCPWWLNEGLAQYLSDDADDDTGAGFIASSERSQPEAHKLSDLGGVFGLDQESVARSYSMALSAVRYFIASYGETAIQKIIMLMVEGSSFETAFHTATGYSFDGFEEEWRRNS